ncbi:universal stress protein [Arenibaculum sp.]|uniref:universal stress protein n=1 Tax=Arenibaculum sp. TaxID=2865862 RepID=UPI002E0D2264|nr:universal stress protein [Arenibaculum sp.]
MAGGEGFKFLVCVDRSPHSRPAVRFASLRARNIGGTVALLHVLPPAEFQTLLTVAETIEEEERADAELFLQTVAAEVHALSGRLPELHIRVGSVGDSILGLLADQPGIDALVVGAAPPSERRGRLISWLAGQLAGSIEIPLLIVPGNLSDEQLARHT